MHGYVSGAEDSETALKHLSATCTEKKRKIYMKERYAKQKMSNSLIGRGYGKHGAKLLGAIIDDMIAPNPAGSQVAREADAPTETTFLEGLERFGRGLANEPRGVR